RRGMWTRLDRGETTYDFVGKRWRGYVPSILLTVAGVVALFASGLNLGIDFEGGVSWELPAVGISTDDVEAVLEDNGLEADRIQTLRGSDGERIRAQVPPLDQDAQLAVRAALAERAGLELSEVSLNSVGPSWGDEI